MNQHGNNILKLIQKLGYHHASWQVFSDFVEMGAIAISNSVDWVRREDREKHYLEIINKYEPKEQAIFPEMLGELVLALEEAANTDGPEDVLGSVYHGLELHNKWTGQFFTPVHVAEMMGEMAIGDYEAIIHEKGYVTVSEPCAGSGSLVLGFAKAMKKRGLNYCSQMVVTAVDIDIKCVCMTYIQLSLYGIPAVVIHGDTLAVKEWSRWETPVYIVDGWWARQRCGITVPAETAKKAEELPEPISIATRKGKKSKPEQMALIDLGEYENSLKKENVR